MAWKPIKIDPAAELYSGVFVITAPTFRKVWAVVVTLQEETIIDGVYNQESLARQHIEILNSPMRQETSMKKAVISKARNVTSLEDLLRKLKLSLETNVHQLLGIYKFHVFSSLALNVGNSFFLSFLFSLFSLFKREKREKRYGTQDQTSAGRRS